jgi:hypothetical protein
MSSHIQNKIFFKNRKVKETETKIYGCKARQVYFLPRIPKVMTDQLYEVLPQATPISVPLNLLAISA